MKKIASVLLSSALVVSMAAVSAVSVSADVTEIPADWDPTEYTYTVVGDANLLGADAWQPENDAYNMNYDEVAGVWYLNLTGVANDGETAFDYGAQYKVVVRDYLEDKPWEFSFNETGVAFGEGSNSLVDFGETAETAETVTIMFDGEKTSSRIDNLYTPAEAEEHTYFAVGSDPLFDPAWDPAAPAYQLTKGEDGIYSVEIPVTEEMWDSDISYKVAQDGTWDVSYNDKGEALGDGTNALLYIAEGTTSVVITFNPETLCTAAECKGAVEEPTEAPTDEATEAPTDEATEAPTDEATAPTEEGTEASTDDATNAPTDAVTAPTSATSATNATTATTKTTTSTTSTTSSATGKVATGDSTSVALLIGMLMLAGAGVVVARKRIAE